jgi:peptide/nickel transport system substrate-binding protein
LAWAALGASLLVGTSSCTRVATTAVATKAGSPQHTFVFTGMDGEPDTLNVMLTPSSDTWSLSHLYLSYLVESDDRGALIPEIARRVPTRENGDISADGRTIVYHLRPGVKWQDGAPLTARDVVFTQAATMNPATNVISRVGYAEIATIAAPDPLTVVLHLRRPYAPIVAVFCGPEGFGILPAHLLASYRNLNHVAFNALPIGSGPFRVLEWRHGDRIVFAANPLYWRGKPRLDRLVYRITPSPNTRLVQLQTGEADGYFDADPQLLPQLTALPGVRVALTPVNDLHAIAFNLRDPIVGDLRVRQAIALAIDRRKLITAATHESGIAIDGDQPQNGWAYRAGASVTRYDPRAAAALLDAAGWHTSASGIRMRNGRALEIGLTISPQGVNGSPLVATLVQGYLHDVGIAVSIKAYTVGQMFGPKATGGILQSGAYQIAYSAWWILGPDPDDTWQFACDQISPAGQNSMFWCNPRADAAMHAALTTFDQATRKREYGIVENELRHDLPEFTLWQVKMPNVARTGLTGFSPAPFGSTFWNAWHWQYSR